MAEYHPLPRIPIFSISVWMRDTNRDRRNGDEKAFDSSGGTEQGVD